LSNPPDPWPCASKGQLRLALGLVVVCDRAGDGTCRCADGGPSLRITIAGVVASSGCQPRRLARAPPRVEQAASDDAARTAAIRVLTDFMWGSKISFTNARRPRAFLDYGKARFGMARPFGRFRPFQRVRVAAKRDVMSRPIDRSDVFQVRPQRRHARDRGAGRTCGGFLRRRRTCSGRTDHAYHAAERPDADGGGAARGQADALALRVAHHNTKAHAKAMPQREDARRLFEAAERARIESIGAAVMDGMAENLDAVLQQRCERAGYARVTDKARAPMDDALEFVLREALTGRKLPPPPKALPSCGGQS